MKSLMQWGLCCWLAPGLLAGHNGGGAAPSGSHAGGAALGRKAAHPHGSMHRFGRAGYGGYGYGGYGYGGYGYDGFYGGYDEPFDDYGYSQAADAPGSNVTVVYPPAAPAVTIAQTAHPVIHEYSQAADYGTSTEAGNHPILYLIAFRDSTIRAVMTYWVAGATLHYLDTGHKEKQAPLASVDRDLSAQLNRERHVPFNLP